MRTTFFLFISFISSALFGQTAIDTVAVKKQVDSLIQASVSLAQRGDFDKALESIATTEKLALEKLGWQTVSYARCIMAHGHILFYKQDFAGAEKWYLETKAIREKVAGKEHRDYVNILHYLGYLYDQMGDNKKSEPLYLEANSITEKIQGKECLDYAYGLDALGNIYANKGDYEKAEPLCLQAKITREKILGKEHPDYIISLNNLAAIYAHMGLYEKAEPLWLEAKITQEKILGKEHPHYILTLNNLANFYNYIGFYEKAEPLCFEAKSILEKLGKEHSNDYAATLNNLAHLYKNMGNYDKAEPLLQQVLNHWKKVKEENPVKYAMSLNGLGNLYYTIGNYEKAVSLMLEAKTVSEKAVGKENPDYALFVSNLAVCYLQMGEDDKSEPLQLEAKALREKTVGKEHPEYAGSLTNLATLNLDKGEHEKAEIFCLEAKTIYEKTLGKESPEYVGNLSTLIELYEKTKRFAQADSLLLEFMTLEQSRILKATTFQSEREIEQYTASFLASGNYYDAFLLARYGAGLAPKNSLLAGLLYDHALFHKGLLLNHVSRLRVLAASSPEAEETSLRLKGYRRRLAAEYAMPIAERHGVEELEEKANAAEKELARSVIGYAEAIRPVNWKTVQTVLKKEEIAIEFIHFQVKFPKNTDSIIYAAIILLPTGDSSNEGSPKNQQPLFVPLFEEKELQNLLKTTGTRKADYVNSIYSIQKTTENSLYELLWKPLEKHLAGIRTVYFSPSGLLHRLNLNAIPINENETLSDRYHLVEMGSTRQLAISPESNKSAPDAGQALLFGGVQYDLNTDSIASQNIDIESNITGTRGNLNFSYTDSTDRGGSWNYLKWTDKEVTALEPILRSAQIQTTVRKGYTATEEAFKSIGSNVGRVSNPSDVTDVTKSPRILHIATHGYFFPDPVQVRKTEFGMRNDAEPVFKMSDHPMIRSGLILAGGNHAWKTGKPFREGMEDGILTAYEISQMDLSNTELVVLSACETGLGDIQGNEGVYGLQRAFKIAGAKYLIMSLWQVPDFQTQELMTAFYTNWLTKQMSIPDAFRAAQQAMREKYEHPYFWAGFVLVE